MMKQTTVTAISSLILLLGAARAAPNATQAPGIQPANSHPSLSFEVSSGIVDGEACEYVFWYGDDNRRTKLSELDWDIDRVLMAGGRATARLHRIFFRLGAWAAVTEGEDGHLLDYDWTDINQSSWTDFSDSNADVVNGLILDANLGWDFLQQKQDGLTLSGTLGWKVDKWKWEGHGGYALYSEYGYVPYFFDDDQIEIRYTQEIRIPYVGLAADWTWRSWVLSAHINYSPLVQAEDRDYHVFRQIEWHDTFEDGDFLGVGAGAQYTFQTGIILSATLDFQSLDTIIGNLAYTESATGEQSSFSDSAGLENRYLAFFLGLGTAF